MPRKMKKRYKMLMSYYDDCRKAYYSLKKLTENFSDDFKDAWGKTADNFINSLIIAKCMTLGIYPADIAKIEYNKELQTSEVTLKGGLQNFTIALEIDGGMDNGNN